MVDEPGTNRALHLVDSLVKRLAILDQRSELTMGFRWRMNALSSPMAAMRASLRASSLSVFRFTLDHRQASSLVEQTKVLSPETHCEIVDPSRGTASFHNDKFDLSLVLLEDRSRGSFDRWSR